MKKLYIKYIDENCQIQEDELENVDDFSIDVSKNGTAYLWIAFEPDFGGDRLTVDYFSVVEFRTMENIEMLDSEE